MSHCCNVLVVGGGVVGLTAALAMAQRNYTVVVVDAGDLKTTTSLPDLRVYAINQASQSLLTELAVWPCLDKSRLSPYSTMEVWDSLSEGAIHFDSRSIARSNLGTIIEESVLKNALLERIALESKISLVPNCVVDEVCTRGDGVKVSSKDLIWEADLLMVADGAHSPTRQQLKVPVTTWPYNQQAIVATVRTEKPHEHCARQVFNPEGPLAFLPLANEHECSIVWSTDTPRSKELMGRENHAFNEALFKAFSGVLGEVQVLSARHSFPLHMRHAEQYSGAGWLLLGDAAHTIHPLAGLGLNLGLADVRSWMSCLDTHTGQAFSIKQLKAYQRERKHAVWQTILLMEGFKRLFSHTLAPITTLRGLGLRACNELTPIKRLFIQHAIGESL